MIWVCFVCGGYAGDWVLGGGREQGSVGSGGGGGEEREGGVRRERVGFGL